MLEVEILYAAGWALMLSLRAGEAPGKSLWWCIVSAVGCALWPSALVIGALANKLAEQEVQDRRR